MSDYSSFENQGLAENEDGSLSPALAHHVGEAIGDRKATANNGSSDIDEDDDEDDEDNDDPDEKQDASQNTMLDAACAGDENASNASSSGGDTENLFPPTPRSLSPPFDEPNSQPQPLGLHRRFGRSSFDDYDVITVHGVRDDRNTAWTSRNGGSWIKDELFSAKPIRLLNYSYETDDSAHVFTPNGIDAEARALLDSVARVRAKDPETEQDRPIVWICHDIGGSIVKQALINAIRLQPAVEPDDDADMSMESLRNIYRKIPSLSSTMIFLGCPHRARTIEDLEDELHMLLSLPGPTLKRRILRKISNLARQIDDINSHFLETSLLSRVLMLNIFSIPSRPVSTEKHEQTSPSPEQVMAEKSHFVELDTTTLSTPSAPFSEYTLTIFHQFPAPRTARLTEIDHSGLVRGSDSVANDQDWVTCYRERFNSEQGFTIKNNYRLLQLQQSFLSLAPPTRATKVHLNPKNQSHITSWIFDQQAFKAFSKSHVKSLYLHTATRSHLDIEAITQHLSFAYHNEFELKALQGSVICFEFDQHDARRDSITGMILCLINTLAWRFWPLLEDELSYMSEYLESYQSWSLDDALNLFFDIMDDLNLRSMVILLGSFDQCVDSQRQVFLSRYVKYRSLVENPFRLIVSTRGPQSSLSKTFAPSEIINLEDCPFGVDRYSEHAQGFDALASSLQSLLDTRHVLVQFETEIQRLLGQCGDEPYLGYRILQWLEHYGKEAPTVAIASAIGALSPVTHHNMIRSFLDSSGKENERWAELVCRWIKHAAEPLTIEMLAQAVAVHRFPENPPLEDLNYDDFYQEIQQILGGIVVREGCVVRFSDEVFYHLPHTAREEQGKLEPEASRTHEQMARTCLYYLLSTAGQYMLGTLSMEGHGIGVHTPPLMLPRDSLVGYALRYWAAHYQASLNPPADLAMKLLQDHGKSRAWAEAYYVVSNPFTRIHRSYLSPLPYMAMLGLEDLVSKQMSIQRSEESFKSDCWLAITEASRNGHQATLDLLLGNVELDEAGLRDSIQYAAICGKRELLDTLIPRAQAIENFHWPQYILCRAAAIGLENLVSALAAAGYNMNEEDLPSKRRALHLAATFGQTSVLALMTGGGGADLTLKNAFGGSPFSTAAFCQGPETLQHFLDAKIDINNRDEDGAGVVQHAVSQGRHASLEILIKAGADFKSGKLDSSCPWLIIPLVAAAVRGYQECTRILLSHGADPNAFCEYYGSALYAAIEQGPYIEVCRMLLEKGADPNQSAAHNKVYKGRNMLLLQAICTNNTDLVAMLLDHGAELHSVDPSRTQVDTPLTYAVAFSTIKMVELLLERGADPNFMSAEHASWSPIYAAALNEDPGYIELLAEHGADLNCRLKIGKWTPLMASWRAPSIIRSLLKHGSDINAKGGDDEGLTTLMLAARDGQTESVRTLLQHQNPKPDLEAEDEEGWTALLFACSDVHVEAARLLLEAGADVNHKDIDGCHALGICCYNSSSEKSEQAVQTIKTLLEHGADSDSVELNGDATLHSVRGGTPISVIKALVEAGVPVDTANNDGYTPLGQAILCNNIEAAEYLMAVDGVRVDVCHPNYGSILHMAVRSTYPASLTRKLIAKGADHTVLHPKTGESVLYAMLVGGHPAPYAQQVEVLRFLIGDLHTDVNIHGGFWEYPILRSLLSGKGLSVLKYLLRHGARTGVTDKLGRGPAHYAATQKEGSQEALAALFKRGISLHTKDHLGQTPLHLAAAKSSPATVRYLLDHLSSVVQGFDVNEADIDGWTPLMWACKRSYDEAADMEEVTRILIDEYGADIWARSKDAKWSPLKIGRFHGYDENRMTGLAPVFEKTTRRVKDGGEETWNPTFHQITAGHGRDDGIWCYSCFTTIWDTRWVCDECTECSNDTFDLCFKCIRHGSKMHDAKHSFHVHGEEAEVDQGGGEDSEAEESESESETKQSVSSVEEHSADAVVGGEANGQEERHEGDEE